MFNTLKRSTSVASLAAVFALLGAQSASAGYFFSDVFGRDKMTPVTPPVTEYSIPHMEQPGYPWYADEVDGDSAQEATIEPAQANEGDADGESDKVSGYIWETRDKYAGYIWETRDKYAGFIWDCRGGNATWKCPPDYAPKDIIWTPAGLPVKQGDDASELSA